MRLLSTGGCCSINPLSLEIGRRISNWNTGVFLGSYQPDVEAGTIRGLVLANDSELVMERLTPETAKLFERTTYRVIEEAPHAFTPQPTAQVARMTFKPGGKKSSRKEKAKLDRFLELTLPRSQLFFTGGEWKISADVRGDTFYVFRSKNRYVEFGKVPVDKRPMNILAGFLPEGAPRFRQPSGIGAFFLSGIFGSSIEPRYNLEFAAKSSLAELKEFLGVDDSPLGVVAFETLKRIAGFYSGLKGIQLKDEVELTTSNKSTRHHMVHDQASIVPALNALTQTDRFTMEIKDKRGQEEMIYTGSTHDFLGNNEEAGIRVRIHAPENQRDFRLTGDLRTLWDICRRQYE